MRSDFLKKIYQRQIILFNIIFLLFFLYLFLVSLELMGASLKMFGGGLAESLIATTTNPLVGLFIGILSTSIIQSSSSTTSIVVGLVAGGALNVANAIPIVMGANIGTSVTNLLVSLSQIRRNLEFRRALSAAIVHDFFNILAVIILFPLQYFTNFLGYASAFIGEKFQNLGGLNFLSPVKHLTKPPVKILANWIGDYPWILLGLSLVLLLLSLTRMVKALKILVVKKAEAWFDLYLFKNAGRAFLVGMLLTAMVQSSSITTSLAVPMAGAGVLTLAQIFPYTLGANVGTTVTAFLAALVTGNLSAIIVAFSHFLFNASGILIFWPLKFIPIGLAEKFSAIAVRKKYIAILYIIVVFFLVPVLLITILR
jgi:sodium-dependent phosphate cotransporter